MFEKWLGKLLNGLLGRYIQGFDADNLNLSLWSGEVTLENVRLREEVVKLLGLPLVVRYSHIRKLRLKIPWKSLTSSKTQIFLDGVYLILGYQPEAEWELHNKKLLEQRKSEVREFREEVLKRYTERSQKKNPESDDGFTSRLILKIIDNLQVEVSDIHLRFQDQEEEEYAFGVTLESLKMNTVNRNGVEEYIDRTKPENQGEPIRKHLQLVNMGVYWSRKARMTERVSASEEVEERLRTMIKKNEALCPYVVLVSFSAKLFQSKKGVFSVPETLLQMDMQSVKIDVDDRQLQQMITLSEKFQRYKRKVRALNSLPLSLQQQQAFADIYSKYYGKEEKDYSPQDLFRYERILEQTSTENLMRIMKHEILQREKQRMVTEKSTVKTGWFSYGKKELSPEELQQIEDFVVKNFNEEYKPVRRPADYFYFVLEANFRQVELMVSTKQNYQSNGVALGISDFELVAKVREEGYHLKLSLDELHNDLFTVNLTTGQQVRTNIFSKIEKFRDQKYLQLEIDSNPPASPNIGLAVTVSVRASSIVFDPELINRIKKFTELKINQQNREAAIEGLGEIRTKTSMQLSKSLKQRASADKKLTKVNVSITAPLVIIPFQTKSKERCWGINMGLLQIHTDPDLLKQEAPTKSVFVVRLDHLNFGWFGTVEGCQRFYEHGVVCKPMQNLLEDFQINFIIEQCDPISVKQPKLSIKATVPTLDLKLSEYSFKQLKKLDQALAVPKANAADLPQGMTDIRVVTEDEKEAILRNREKLGVLYKRNNTSKLWERYTCVLSGNYLYLYGPSSKVNYDEYIYAKNSEIRRVDEAQCGRPNTFELSNKVDVGVLFSFDKPTQRDEWEKAIIAKRDPQLLAHSVLTEIFADIEDSSKNQQSVMNINYEQLNLSLALDFKHLQLTVYEDKQEDNWLDVRILNFSTSIDLYEARKDIRIVLSKLDVYDNVQKYRNPELNSLLKTDTLGTDGHLIILSILQMDPQDPNYAHCDNQIKIQFGVQRANWKPQTIRKIFQVFLPSEPENPADQLIFDVVKDIFPTMSEPLEIIEPVKKPSVERTLLNIEITVKEISLALVNRNNNVKLYDLLFRRLAFTMTKTPYETNIKVCAGNLLISDCSGYPNTILTEDEYRPQVMTFLRSLDDTHNDNLVEVTVRIIKEVDPGQKDLFVNVAFNRVYIDFMKQPFLRTIDYIIYQFIPSLNGEPDKPPQRKSSLKKPKKEPPIKHPEYSTWGLNVSAVNSVARLRPSVHESEEVIDLHINKIVVRKENFNRDYITDKSGPVLVTAYIIEVTQTYITVRDYQITNGLDFQVTIDSIEEPRYYRREYGDKFEDGMRLYLNFGAFLIRVSNRDFNTVLKCLKWNVSYDDNCSKVLLPEANQEQPREADKEERPFYLSVKASKITLVAATKANIPIVSASVHRIDVALVDYNSRGLTLQAAIGELTGSSFSRNESKIVERGMLSNTATFTNREYDERGLVDIPELVRVLYLRDNEILRVDEGFTQLKIQLRITNELGTVVEIHSEQIRFCLDLLPLLQLSKITAGDDSLAPPPPRLPPNEKFLVKRAQTDKNETVEVVVLLTNASISTKNSQFEQETGLSGDIKLRLLLKPPKTRDEVAQIARNLERDTPVENSKITLTANDFTVYLTQTDAKGTTKRRTLLLPVNVLVMMNDNYTILEDKLVLTKYIIVETQTIGLKVTVKDLISLGDIAQQNQKLLADWVNENDVQQRVLEQVREADKEEVTHRLRRKSFKHTESGRLLPEKKESLAPKPPQEAPPAPVPKEDPNKPVTNQTIEISFNQLEAELINDCGSMFVPVLQLLLAQSKPMIRSSQLQTNISTIINIEVNFFNPRSARWEPILEQCRLTLGYIINHGKNQNTEVSVLTDKNDELNINISSQMLRSLEESMTLARLELGSKEKILFQTNTDEELEVSPYVFWNMTNTPIDVIVPEHPRHQTATNLMGPTEKLPLRTKTLPSRYKGSVYVPVQSNEITLRIGQATYAVNINIFGKRRICDSKYFVECKVEKLNRLVKFTGDLYLLNATADNLFVSVLNGKIEEVLPNMQIPLENIERVCFGSEENHMSDSLNLASLGALNNISTFDGHINYSLACSTRNISELECKKFFVHAPMRVLNCLPRPILFHACPRDSKQVTAAKPIKSQAEVELYRYGQAKDLVVRISAPGYFWSPPLDLSQNINKQIDIVLKDKHQNPTVVRASIVLNESNGVLLLTFFTTAYLINDTPYDLLVYSQPKESSQRQQYRVAGQFPAAEGEQFDSSLIMLGPEVSNLLKFAEKSTPDELSSEVRIDQLGYNETLIEIRQAVNGTIMPTYLTLGVDVAIKEMYKDSQVLTKEVRVTTRHIIVNKTGLKLFYKQMGTDEVFQLEKDQRRVAFLLDKDPEKRKVIFRSDQSEESAPISMRGLGTTHFYVMEHGQMVFMQLTVRVADNFVFLLVGRQPHNQPPYQLYNRVPKLTIQVPQLDEEVVYKERANFSWRNPDDSHVITLNMTHDEAAHQTIEIDPDQVNSKKTVSMTMRNGKQLKLEILNDLGKTQDTRIITIQEEVEQPPEDDLYFLARSYFSRIGISFILNHETVARPYEFVYGYLENLEFINERTTTMDTYQVKLGFMQIDQNYPNELVTPVIFTPQRYNVFAGSAQNHLINAVVRIDRHSYRHIIFKEVAVEVKDITVRVSEHFIKALRDISRDTTKNQQDYMIVQARNAWQELELPEQSSMLYIQQMSIFPFNVQLTCHIKPTALQENRGYVFEEVAIQAFGIAFTNLEEAMLTLKGITLTNSYDTLNGLVNKLIVHYKRNFFNEIYKIFGSLNIIGNPLGLFNNITTGLTDLIARPVQGAVEGPLELGRGIVSGTHSLFAHTLGGALNSISQITASVANGFTILCFDPHFEEIRIRRRINPPASVLDGLGKGAVALYQGVREGITGVVGQPARGVQKNGPIGGMLGLITGLTGVVIKPATGVLDALTQSAQGLKSSIMGHEDRANIKRIRSPRVFYGGNSLIKSYNQTDSHMYQALEELDLKYTNSPFIQSFMLKDERYALVVLESYVVLLDRSYSNITWAVDIKNIEQLVSGNGNGNELTILMKKEKLSIEPPKTYMVACADGTQRDELKRLLTEMVQLGERVIEDNIQ